MTIDWDAFAESFFDFLKHVTIVSKDEGRVKLEMYDAQRYFFDEIFDGFRHDKHWFVCGKGRQVGITTGCYLFNTFYAGAIPGVQGAIVFDSADNLKIFRELFKESIETLPKSHRLPIKGGRDNRTYMAFENGNMLQYLIAGTKKGQGSLGRSRGINYCHASEVSYYGDPEAFENFKNTLSDIFPYRCYIFESTGKGYGLLYDLWEDAVADEITKKAVFVTWWRKRSYSYDRGTPLFRKYGWAQLSPEEREATEVVRRDYGVKIGLDQWAWYRHRSDPRARAEGDLQDADERLEIMTQEHPHCVVGGTLIGTNIGVISIAEAYPGLRSAYGTVKATGPTGLADTFEITTKMGYSFIGTSDHPIALAAGGFVDLMDSPGHVVKLTPPTLADHEFTVSWREPPALCRVPITKEMGTFVGLFMGDGSYHADTLSVVFDAKDEDVILLYQQLLHELFGLEGRRRPSGRKEGGVEIRCRARGQRTAFTAMGLVDRRGSDGAIRRTACVPECIRRSPRHVVRQFLRGLFDADGYVGGAENTRIVLSAKDPDFLREVQLLVLAFGVTCRLKRRSQVKATGVYPGYTLEFRYYEASAFMKAIGFLSDRKEGRCDEWKQTAGSVSSRLPMVLEDIVASVKVDRVAVPVYNLTIEGSDNVFDAGGILTHNTPENMFRGTGSPFILPQYISPAENRAQKALFKAYSFHLGDDVTTTRIEPTRFVNRAQLRVWLEPHPNGVYVVAADPAGGASDEGNQFCIQVLRCYADRLVQVAEFCDANVQPFQFAWIILYLCGWYGDCRYIVEINSYGEAVMVEIRHLVRLLQDGLLRPARADVADPTEDEVQSERRWRHIFDQVRQFLYRRADSLSGGAFALQMKTNLDNKFTFMTQMADRFTLGELEVNSVPCLREMRTLRKDGRSIAAEAKKQDDRPVALGLAVRAYIDQERSGLWARNATYEAETARDALAGDSEDMSVRFMSGMMANAVAQKARYRREQVRSARRGQRWNW